jgi:DNA-directed RNA polymerase alpha subunit
MQHLYFIKNKKFFFSKKMNMDHFLLSCIEYRVENNRSLYGRFQLGPFDKSQGLTIANAIRRTLLSELSGLAIFCVEIQGVNHEYSNLKGVRESVLDVLLNLKQIVFSSNKKLNQPEIGFLKLQGPKIVKACDLKLPSFIQCVDPNQYITTLSDNGILEMKFMICEGKNFLIQTPSELIQKSFDSHFFVHNETQHDVFEKNNSTAEVINTSFKQKFYLENLETFSSINNNNSELKNIFVENQINFKQFENDLMSHKQKTTQLQPISNLPKKQDFKKKTSTNLLFIDAVFMPIKKVNFSIQNINNYSKVEQSNLLSKFKKNYLQEKIILEIWTNGSIHPQKAIYEAIQKIIDIFIPLQKIYSYKKTKLTIKAIESNKSISHSLHFGLPVNKDKSLFTGKANDESNQNSFINLKNIFKITKTNNFKPNLNKIYRPWFNSLQFKSIQNDFLMKQKKISKHKNSITTDIEKKLKLNQSIANQFQFFDISYLNLSPKLYICLKRANINTIQNLLLHSRDELLLIKNLGEKSVKKIESILAKKNFKLRSEM